MFWGCLSRRIFIGLKSRLKNAEIDNEARISKKAEMKGKFNRNQKHITPWDIQISFLIFLILYKFSSSRLPSVKVSLAFNIFPCFLSIPYFYFFIFRTWGIWVFLEEWKTWDRDERPRYPSTCQTLIKFFSEHDIGSLVAVCDVAGLPTYYFIERQMMWGLLYENRCTTSLTFYGQVSAFFVDIFLCVFFLSF